jgi:hypothetical protein
VRQTSRPAPHPEDCLLFSHLSSPKGGTLIAEGVHDVQEHRRRLCDPDGYRPQGCARCGHGKLHVHDYRTRGPRDAGGEPVSVVRYLCPCCQATYQVLPQFVARHLWSSWPTVQAHTIAEPPPPGVKPVPERTRRRWLARLLCAALLLVQVLAQSGSQALEGLAKRVGLWGTRAELVTAYQQTSKPPPSQVLSGLAALLHRLCPCVRLM